MASARGRSRRTLAIERVTVQLAALGNEGALPVVVDAPDTPIYVQFMRERDHIVGESVSETNLPRLIVHSYLGALSGRLRELGWTEPDSLDAGHAGNWTRTWRADEWNAAAAARLAVRTLTDAYGIEPWAIVATAVTG